MFAKFDKSLAKGMIVAPASKSVCHRLIIGAALAEGESNIENISSCRDCRATIDCLRSLGAIIDETQDGLRIKGFMPKAAKTENELYCDESGSTLRFLLPIALLSERKFVFSGKPRLIERPHGVYEDLCLENGLHFKKSTNTIEVSGPLTGGVFKIPGNVSSQFITGLLFALPLLEEDSRIILTTEVESKSYINITIDCLNKFGVKVIWENEKTLYVKGAQKYTATNLYTEGDYSGAAFMEAFNLFGGKVEITGLSEDSLQGDKIYREYFRKLSQGTPTLSLADCPDLGPILFAVAAAKNGAVFTDTQRLKIKESDRASTMACELRKFGADIEVLDNSVKIKKTELHAPNEPLYGHNDHRIVMSLSVLLSLFGGVIKGAEAINKSYGEFFEHLNLLGVKVKTYEV